MIHTLVCKGPMDQNSPNCGLVLAAHRAFPIATLDQGPCSTVSLSICLYYVRSRWSSGWLGTGGSSIWGSHSATMYCMHAISTNRSSILSSASRCRSLLLARVKVTSTYVPSYPSRSLGIALCFHSQRPLAGPGLCGILSDHPDLPFGAAHCVICDVLGCCILAKEG